MEIIEHQAQLTRWTGSMADITFDGTENALYLEPNQQLDSPRKKLLQLSNRVRILQANFGSVKGAVPTLTLRPDGSASPGSVVLRNEKAEQCSIIQSLRGARRLTCT